MLKPCSQAVRWESTTQGQPATLYTLSTASKPHIACGLLFVHLRDTACEQVFSATPHSQPPFYNLFLGFLYTSSTTLTNTTN